MPEDVRSENIEIRFQDEARVGQRGTVTRIWARRGSRPRVIRQQQFEYTYIFGAVCPMKDQAVGLYAATYRGDCKAHRAWQSKELSYLTKWPGIQQKNYVCLKTYRFCHCQQRLLS